MHDPAQIYLFGGSFNPPHTAHVGFVRHLLGLAGPQDEVWVIPTGKHAFGKPLADFRHRMAMCRLAFEKLDPRVRISEIEHRLPQPNRTIDTVDAIREKHPGSKIKLAVGSDLVAEQPQWKEFNRLMKLVTLVQLPRAGYGGINAAMGLTPFLPEVSSTELRERLKAGESPETLPPGVAEYVREHGLYRE